ncbi:hypothetical protein HMPREF9419_1390 [Prevotella nigrescens ATCC 33563]|nr:hypothetical protein HMPREF9419_1390 [Prevotella nigrescens ATCC 33563]
MNCRLLIEYIPLQQGLRPFTFLLSTFTLFLIEYIPLQQGLRRLVTLSNCTKLLSH